ncbi:MULTISPECIES: EscC/YscC/HrcC family type III secretion system outer membrane ring protein [Providencia]|uniref:EscC/YscC/HrcC family type III secretion system outer membrane ring protein n=1 Tax=Providencia TaxID=586 RepID=UPI0005B31BDA|nr:MULTISPECIES: EscC/YscC/HrcC family type III secretion system outer membrane ring protein [Providencia]APC09833.1 Type III secretion system outer membrane protein SpiA precursor [Providencia rettgeri]AVL73493.1 EscC/YscC/HrcC family type III secretion system outer membrane ring protein [Providencia rettgeri]EIU9517051.1 EscC/YscC/HrcC family type III secretion system outer membrane ring protein [Providencia rettgeri]EKH6497604.1 EscC/YscC/HrcC family type III secretion system outer membrane 
MIRILFVFITIAALHCYGALASTIPWKNDSLFFISSRGSKLSEVLRDFGANYNIPVIVSNQIDDIFVGTIPKMLPELALNKISRMHKLAWYYDGQALYFYKAQEVSSELIAPTYLNINTFIQQLKNSNILGQPYCQASIISASNTLQIQGVPICIQRIEAMATRIDAQKLNQDQNQEEIRVFPLKYANAADGNYEYRGQKIIVPGIISVLKDMAQGRTLPLLQNQGQPSPTDSNLPMFSVDQRQNAIIIRDRKLTMPRYASLITQLDKKPVIIEISVLIVDVNAEDLSTLGIDWSASAQIGGGNISLNNNGIPDTSSFSSIVSNTSNFMIKLNALQQNAKAQILSRPSIVTLDNNQAVLDRSITFHTKLIADNTAKLDSISTGSLLRVTPRLIEEQGKKEIMLTLSIQDGRQIHSTSELEPLPQTLSSEVSTQTLLQAGQSLLLGGFVQDEHSEGERRIPLLSDIPIIGGLFNSSQKNNRSTIRLFLIKAQPANLYQ